MSVGPRLQSSSSTEGPLLLCDSATIRRLQKGGSSSTPLGHFLKSSFLPKKPTKNTVWHFLASHAKDLKKTDEWVGEMRRNRWCSLWQNTPFTQFWDTKKTQKGYSISLRVPIHTIAAAGAASVGVAGPHCGIDATDTIAVRILGASGIERILGRTLSSWSLPKSAEDTSKLPKNFWNHNFLSCLAPFWVQRWWFKTPSLLGVCAVVDLLIC